MTDAWGNASSTVNVSTFGASPSKTAAQNNVAIAAAIAALPSAGGTVIFPETGYFISSSIIIDKDNVGLFGYGQRGDASIIAIDPSADPTYALIVGNTKLANSCLISGLAFIGKNSTTSTGKGILFRSNGGKMFETKVALFGGTGVDLQGIDASHIAYEVFLEDVEITTNGMNSVSSGDGLAIGDFVSDSEFHRVICSGDSPGHSTTNNGFSNTTSGQLKFVDCHAYQCKNDGFFNNTGIGFQIIGGEWENNAGNGIESAGASTIITAAACFGNGNFDIRCYSSAIISDCQCSSIVNGNLFANSASGGTIHDNQLSGSFVAVKLDTGASGWSVHDNKCSGTGATVISTASTNSDIHDNIVSGGGNIVEVTGAQGNNIHDNTLVGGGTITQVGTTTHIKDNPGFNPRGHAVTQPAVPATTVAATNTTGCDCTVLILGGTLTVVAIGGSATGITAAAAAGSVHSVRVPVGQTIAITYSVAPTWQWFGD